MPFYEELEKDLAYNNSYLINTFSQHSWIADFHYYDELHKYTFPTWDQRNFHHCSHKGAFVVKGRTNSRKHQWNKLMFAPTKRDAIDIGIRLLDDPLISQQGIIYREYVPLRTFEIGLNDLPFANEWRFFYLRQQRLAHGYYWTEADDVDSPQIDDEGLAFADEVARIVAQHVNFFVLDIGEKKEGGWILIEVNDAQMSGLSMIQPEELYRSLAKSLTDFDLQA